MEMFTNIRARATKHQFQDQEPTTEEAKKLLELKPLGATENTTVGDTELTRAKLREHISQIMQEKDGWKA